MTAFDLDSVSSFAIGRYRNNITDKLRNGPTAAAAVISGMSDSPPTNLTFKVASKRRSLKIRDVMNNGICLLNAKRQEVTAIMAKAELID